MRNLALAAAIMLVPQLAQAEAYRCKQANGTLAFQDHPCQNGSSGSIVSLPPVQGYSPGSVGQPAASDKRRPGDEVKSYNAHVMAENERTLAENKERRCVSARRELGVLKEQRPVYHRDNDGNRVYMEDKERPGAMAAAQEQVDGNCE